MNRSSSSYVFLPLPALASFVSGSLWFGVGFWNFQITAFLGRQPKIRRVDLTVALCKEGEIDLDFKDTVINSSYALMEEISEPRHVRVPKCFLVPPLLPWEVYLLFFFFFFLLH